MRAPPTEPNSCHLISFASKTVVFSLGTHKIREFDVILRRKRVMCSLLFLGITKLGNGGPRFVEIARRRGGARVAQFLLWSPCRGWCARTTTMSKWACASAGCVPVSWHGQLAAQQCVDSAEHPRCASRRPFRSLSAASIAAKNRAAEIATDAAANAAAERPHTALLFAPETHACQSCGAPQKFSMRALTY